MYAIDTPPPTVSGSLHLGTVFGYVQFDSIARFWRMHGKEVFFPVGWDDNGLPTIRRVQNHYGVRCDPTLPYEPNAAIKPGAGERAVSRRNFIELCHRADRDDERVFEQVFREVGPLGGLGAHVHDHQRPVEARGRNGRSCATSLAGRPT